MLRFRLFGYDIDVQFFFLLTAVFIVGGFEPPFDIPMILINVVMVFIAVLSHELGHAFAMTHYKLDPSITLASFGGFTTPNARGVSITRPQGVFISLAGPFTGFAQAALLYAIFKYTPAALVLRLPPLLSAGLYSLFWFNIIWGVFNLIPCLPLDGGHVLAHALGPRRARLAVIISLGVAILAGAAFAVRHQWYAAIFFAIFAFQNYQRLQLTPPDAASRPRPERVPEEMPVEASALLQSARHALSEENFERALTLARRTLEGDEGSFVPTPSVRLKAFEIVAWTKLQQADLTGATDALAEARRAGDPDSALVGSLALAKGENAEARRVLEAAHGKGDDRREVVGPLVQALLADGEVGRAAAVALEIVDQLSDDDVRKMAGIAFGASAFEWSGRLSEALFARTRLGDDAYEAARGFAKDGDVERATDMLRRAVDAGFSDRARAWSDAALEGLRARSLDDVLPRP